MSIIQEDLRLQGGVQISSKAIRRRVNGLAWPVILENTFQTALGVVDLAIVSRLGADAVAGVGTATQILFLAIAAFMALATGTTVLVAHNVGAGTLEGARLATKQSLVMGVIVAVLLAAAGSVFAAPLIAVFGLSAHVVALGATYMQISSQLSLFLVLMLVAAAALRGAGDTRSPMMVTGFINIINGVLAYSLVFGHFGLPALGVAGSAWGAALARLCGCCILLILLFRKKTAACIRGAHGWKPRWRLIRTLLQIGLPAMGEQLVINVGFLIYGFMVITLGTEVYAAQRITLNATQISFLPAFGFAVAATALTGQFIGARRPELARKASYYSMAMSVAWMSFAGLMLIVFAQPIMLIFTNDPTIDVVGAAALRVVALCQPFFGVANALAGSLRGSGDTRFPMIAAMLGMWLIRLPVGWFIGIYLSYGLPGVYVSSIADAAVRSLLIWLRYRRGFQVRLELAKV
ncbi:MAG: MATE family efflux transporter [Chloroflexi bacterium]|nr:MATE family efflux transporter [Chloroflexota bacterium]